MEGDGEAEKDERAEARSVIPRRLLGVACTCPRTGDVPNLVCRVKTWSCARGGVAIVGSWDCSTARYDL